MKRLCLVLALLIAITSPLTAQGKKKVVADFLRSISPTFEILPNLAGRVTPKIEGRLLPPQAHVSGTNFVISNHTQYWGKVLAYGTTLQEQNAAGVLVPTKLEPWGSITDTRKYEPVQGADIPILIKFYRDGGLTDYVGAAAGVMRSYGNGYDNSVSWTIEKEMVRMPTGSNTDPTDTRIKEGEDKSPTPTSPPGIGAAKKVSFPKEWFSGQSGVQLLNNIPDSIAVVRMNGKDRLRIEYKDVYYMMAKNYGNTSGGFTFQVIFQHADGTVLGTTDFSLQVQSQGIYVQQLIVNYDDLRRQR